MRGEHSLTEADEQYATKMVIKAVNAINSSPYALRAIADYQYQTMKEQERIEEGNPFSDPTKGPS